MKTSLGIIIGLTLASLAFSRDFRPEGHLENIPAMDSSIQECYIFRTTAGVRYTVQFSNDLTTWTDQDEIYGFGNEYVVPMRQFTAPPAPEPGEPPLPQPDPTPTINASIRMESYSGALGGTVISWASLDHGGPVVVRIAGEMAPEWMQVPLYCNRFGAFVVFVWHPGSVETAPTENPILGTNDSAMLVVLEANLPTMNEEMINSVARTRNAPAPAAPDPDSKRFWRVFVNPEVDTDSDGTPDWSEFEIAAAAQASPPDGGGGSSASGNAFNADTNGDDIPDGQQLDTDHDGIYDAFDIAAEDGTATFPISPLPRYALFPITNAQPQVQMAPFQISDRGTVLYEDGTWTGGVWTPLTAAGGEMSACWARSINDHNVILGGGRIEREIEDGTLSWLNVCYWPSPSAVPQAVSIPSGASETFPEISYDLAYEFLSYGPVLSNSGKFFQPTYSLDDSEIMFLRWSEWTLPSQGQPASEAPAASDLEYRQDPDLKWGSIWSGDTLSNKGLIYAPDALPEPPYAPHNLARMPKNRILAMEYDNDKIANRVFYDGSWHESPTFAKALDIATSGIAIGRNHDGLKAPVLLNGKWTDIGRYAPGVPAEWASINTTLLDTTPGGWILAERRNPTTFPDSGVMLPLQVDGVYNSASPANLEDPAAGVDRSSMGARSGSGHVPEIWIMAPVGGSNTVRFRTPLNAVSTLKLQSNKVTFTPDLLNSADQQIQISSTATATEDVQPSLKLGNQVESLSVPIKLKVMKKRVVKVALHKVQGLGDIGIQTNPQYMPTEAQLEEYLDLVFGRQVNTTFDVTLYLETGPHRPNSEEIGIDFDLNNDHKLGIDGSNPELTAATPHPKAGIANSTVNLDVWVIGGNVSMVYLDGFVEKRALGAKIRETKIIVDGDMANVSGLPDGLKAASLLHTIAHEIGHVMSDNLHPGEQQHKSALIWDGNDGRDPNVKKRLMCSGFEMNRKNPGTCLIKKEWDLIEVWLKSEEVRLGISL